MEKLIVEPIPTNRISAHIEKAIKEAILNGNLKPGDKLPTEKNMASQFGVSLVTLRDGLRALETLGFIVKKKGYGGGIFVSEMDNESIKTSLGHYLSMKELSFQHISEIRMIMEPFSVKLAADNISPHELRMLEENISFCEEILSKASSPFSVKDDHDVGEKFYEFHRRIAESSRNPLLSLIIDYVLDFLHEFEGRTMVPDFEVSMEIMKGHRKILEHLTKGDGEKCEKEMRLHVKKFGEFYEFQMTSKIKIPITR